MAVNRIKINGYIKNKFLNIRRKKYMRINKIISNLIKEKKVKDTVILGLSGGFAGTLLMDISNFLLWRNKQTEGLYGHLAGSMILKSIRTHQTKNFILGQILHIATGSALGIPMVYLFKKTGKDHYIIKGILTGSLLWGILIDFGKRAHWFDLKVRRTKSFYSGLLNNTLYGITSALAIVSLADSSTFPQKQSRNAEQTRKKHILFQTPKKAP